MTEATIECIILLFLFVINSNNGKDSKLYKSYLLEFFTDSTVNCSFAAVRVVFSQYYNRFEIMNLVVDIKIRISS